LTQLLYRIGSHATFFETMLARLSNLCIGSEDECKEGKGRYPLQTLKTREGSDPSIVLLDAWATVADVLTFYQERIANEGFLRTATERRSVLELAWLVGCQPRPGVASSVFLAYTLEDKFKDEVIISKGAKSQSVPGPGELPQSFETSEDLKARAKWNNLKARMTQPQTKESIQVGDGTNQHIYLKGISTNLKPNDPLLIQFGSNDPEPHRVKEVKPDPKADCTLVILQTPRTKGQETTNVYTYEKPYVSMIKALTLRPSVQPPNTLRLSRTLEEQFASKAETGYTAVSTFSPVLRETFATAAANAQVTLENPIKVYALRAKASPFGHNAPKRILQLVRGKILKTGEWPIVEGGGEIIHEEENRIYLDASYEKILPDTWVVVDTTGVPEYKKAQVVPAQRDILVTTVNKVQVNISRAEYGITGNTTRMELTDPWININNPNGEDSQVLADRDFQVIRGTVVHAQSEELKLAEEPIEALVCGGTDKLIEFDGFYEGLESGRWVIVSGERSIPDTSGVRFSELAMIGSVEHKYNEDLLGDKIHTFIKLAKNLEYCFKRDTVTIHGNVVKATHGETRKEVLGSGDGAKALQSFEIKQPPLTYVSASNSSGVDSTLKLFVNDIQWRESDSLAGLSPIDRNFITKTDDEGKTTVTFGNGREGARLPTGVENIKAEYRNGIGKGGNVKAGQISLLTTRPLGVKGVINPLRASGGADKETRNQARRNAPLAVQALDRLVSVQDYEDFARVYAGVGKARAVEISDGRRQVVHVNIAGADDIPIDTNSDLYRNLRQALLDFGDPYQPIQLEIRELMFIVISAWVRILPDYQWESLEPKVRAALLDAFSFERRELGQDVVLSEVVSIIQSVRGVAYVDVDTFGGIPEKKVEAGERRLLTPEEIANTVQDLVNKSQEEGREGRPEPRITSNLADYEEGIIRPAQLAFLTPDVPATLILNQIT
jgi:hypothetical protein